MFIVSGRPMAGLVKYVKYHAQENILVAWHPKSSIENERTTFVSRELRMW